jgi:DNA-binding transcriptional regulator YiaG
MNEPKNVGRLAFLTKSFFIHSANKKNIVMLSRNNHALMRENQIETKKKAKTTDAKSYNDMTEAEKEIYWRPIIHKHKKSGLSQTQFAQQRGISASSLSRWTLRLEGSNPK